MTLSHYPLDPLVSTGRTNKHGYNIKIIFNLWYGMKTMRHKFISFEPDGKNLLYLILKNSYSMKYLR